MANYDKKNKMKQKLPQKTAGEQQNLPLKENLL